MLVICAMLVTYMHEQPKRRILGVSDCDILRHHDSRAYIHHDYENYHDYHNYNAHI